MRGFLRFLVGGFFAFIFILFLGLSAVRFRLLNLQFWQGTLKRARVYEQLEGKVQEMVKNMAIGDNIEKLKQQQKSSKLTSEQQKQLNQGVKFFESLGSLDKTLTATKIQEISDKNVENILGFINGENKRLLLYLPVKDLGLPAELLNQPPFTNLSEATDLEQLIKTTSPPEQADKTVQILKQVQLIAGYLPIIWWGLLLLTILTLVAHFSLGNNLISQVKGTSILLIFVGLEAVIIAAIVKVGVTAIITQAKQMPATVAVLVPDIVTQFFNLGQQVGSIMAGVGLVGVVTAIYLAKSGKIKIEKQVS